jgi:hypothetical protein
LQGAGSRLDWGHRLIDLEGLRPKAYRMTTANAMRFPGAAPAFAGSSIQRARSPREKEAALRAHQEAFTAAAIARKGGVPASRAERQRELIALRDRLT